jgi:aminoglycoside phosphotransferase (APT) family kinase protein
MERAGGLGIPVPAVLGLGMYEAHPYILISYIEGSHGPDVDEEGKRLIWSKLGEYLMKIHQIKTEGYGEDMTAPGVFDGSWSKYLEYNISSLNSEDKLLAQGIISADQSAVLKRTFLELRDAQLTFGLIHNDVSLKNSILGSDGKVYLLDWGSAGVEAIPHMDFAEVLRSSLKEDSIEFALFREAYGISAKELERIKPEISKLQMLGFADKVRWAMDRKPEFLEEKAQELRQALAASRL